MVLHVKVDIGISPTFVDYGSLGLGYVTGASVMAQPRTSKATVTLSKLAGGLTFLPKTEIRLYEVDSAAPSTVVRRFYAGFIDNPRQKSRMLSGSRVLEEYTLTASDYNVLLDEFVGNAGIGERIWDAGFTTFEEQISSIVAQATAGVTTLGGGTIDATSEVALTGSMTGDAATFQYYGMSLREMIQDRCNYFQKLNPAVVPQFAIGMTDTGPTFGSPTLYIWDGALLPTASYHFHDGSGSGGTLVVPMTAELIRDGIAQRTRVQAIGLNDPGNHPTYYVATALSDAGTRNSFKNPYDVRVISTVTQNAWQSQAVDTGGVRGQANVQAVADRLLLARENPRETIVVETNSTTVTQVNPGSVGRFTWSTWGLTDYDLRMAGYDFELRWDGNLNRLVPWWSIQYGNIIPQLGYEGEDVAGPIQIGDTSAPEPPVLTDPPTRNYFDGQFAVADIAYTDSVSNDVEYYIFRAMQGTRIYWEPRVTSSPVTFRLQPALNTDVVAWAVDGNGNVSLTDSNIVNFNAASIPERPSLYNGDFNIQAPDNPTHPDGWAVTETGAGDVLLDTVVSFYGVTSLKIATTASAADSGEVVSLGVLAQDPVNTDLGVRGVMYYGVGYRADAARGTLLIRVDWYTAAGALISSTTLLNGTPAAATETPVFNSGSPPATARYGKFYIKYTGAASGTNNVYLFNARLEKAVTFENLALWTDATHYRTIRTNTGLIAGQEYATTTDLSYRGSNEDGLTVGVRLSDTAGNVLHLDANNGFLAITAADDIFMSSVTGLVHQLADSATNTTTVIETLRHNSSGTPANLFGAGLKFQLKSSTTDSQDAAQIQALWTTATHASRTSALGFLTLTGAGALTEQMRIQGNGRVKVGTVTTVASAQVHVEGQTTNPGLRVQAGPTVSSLGYALSVAHGTASTTTAPTMVVSPISTGAPGIRLSAPASYAARYMEMLDSGGTMQTHFNSLGYLGIGANVTNATSLLHLDGGTSARSPFAVEEGSAPTSTVNGQWWNDSTQRAFQFYLAGIKQTAQAAIFTSTADATIINTTTETSLIGSGVGAKTLPANFWTVGKTVRVRVRGHISTNISAPTLNTRTKLGSVVAASTGAQTVRASLGTHAFEAVTDLTCRTTGASGTIMAQGYFQNAQNPGSTPSDFYQMVNAATVTVDTTASQILDVTAQWGTASLNNTITSTNVTVEVIQ